MVRTRGDLDSEFDLGRRFDVDADMVEEVIDVLRCVGNFQGFLEGWVETSGCEPRGERAT